MVKSKNNDKSKVKVIYEYDETNNAEDIRNILKKAFIAFINSQEIV